ncbi:MAG: phenylalanine--tRNA ligase subunit beta [Clostridiales bacterium]|nr:phenylalanine--tRNA ligase subunit beta [Clostridiales bacterium]
MKLPLNWLREYVDIGDITPEALSDKLLSVGFEVEEIIKPRDDIKNVVVGKVLSMERNANSDKLWVCQIDVGSEVAQIVTGAQNVKQGDVVPVAKVGAELPGGKYIKPAVLRGVESYGMLCSGGELCVDDDVIDGASVDGILILPNNFKIGEDIMHALGIDDTVLDVSITANRPDCQAVVNLAREIAIILGKKFKMPKMTYKCASVAQDGDLPTVTIVNKDLCSRYIGRVIKDVKIEKSPKWMRDRLRQCGIRPINNLVDITNYVLLEFGQPLHAFDRRHISGGIVVRKGVKGEKITALDGKDYEADDVLLIADSSKPLALAGIMGGEYTSILPDTKTVFLEAARFERSNIRRTSRKLGLRSDSSSRYEKGVDWQSTELGSERALALFDELKCGKICDGKTFDGIQEPQEKIITTTKDEICNLLGIDIDKKVIVSLLKKQGIAVKAEGKKLVCTIPLIREDIDGYPDLAEDVMRFYGYDNIVSTNSENTHQTCGGMNVHDTGSEVIKSRLTALGADEILNYSFVSPDACDKIMLDEHDLRRNVITIKNPLSRDISVMRTQLVTGMLSSISRNILRKNSVMRFFELGKIFIPNSLPLKSLPQERDVLCIGLCNDGDFYTIKSIVGEVAAIFALDPKFKTGNAPYLHPGQSLSIDCGGLNGDFGKVHPLVCENYDLPNSVYIAHIDVTDALTRKIELAHYTPLSKLPPVDRDFALVVEKSVRVGDMLNAVKSVSPYVSGVELFDIYEGEQIPEGCKSVAFSMRLQPKEATFSDAEIKSIVNDVLQIVSDKFGAKLR